MVIEQRPQVQHTGKQAIIHNNTAQACRTSSPPPHHRSNRTGATTNTTLARTSASWPPTAPTSRRTRAGLAALALGHGATRAAQVGAHHRGNVVDHLVRPRVRVALVRPTHAVVGVAIDAPVAAAEALRVHARVVAYVVQPRVHPCHGHLRLAGLGHLHLHHLELRHEVVHQQRLQRLRRLDVGVLLLAERGECVEEVLEAQPALALGLRLGENEVHLCARQGSAQQAGALLGKLHEHEAVHRLQRALRRRTTEVGVVLEHFTNVVFTERRCGFCSQHNTAQRSTTQQRRDNVLPVQWEAMGGERGVGGAKQPPTVSRVAPSSLGNTHKPHMRRSAPYLPQCGLAQRHRHEGTPIALGASQ